MRSRERFQTVPYEVKNLNRELRKTTSGSLVRDFSTFSEISNKKDCFFLGDCQ
jgi:hypothetical protein